MEAALQETADRLGTAEFQFFVITLAIQRETGGNLAETLSNLADVLRKRAQMKLKIRAMSSESKASAMIVGSLPFIVFMLVWMINPEYMAGFFVDQRLIVAGIGGLVLDGHRRLHHGQDGQLRDLGNQCTCRLQAPPFSAFDVIWVATMLSAVATFAVLARHLCRDHRQGSDGAPRQGAQRAPRAAEGGHRRVDQQAQEADQQEPGRRPRARHPVAASRCSRTTRSRRPRCG